MSKKLELEIGGEVKTFHRGRVPVEVILEVADYNLERSLRLEELASEAREKYGETFDEEVIKNIAALKLIGDREFLEKTANFASKVYAGQFTVDEFIQGLDISDYGEVTSALETVADKPGKEKTQSEKVRDLAEKKARK